MLEKANRLSKKQFDEQFKHGRKYHFPHCTIVHSPFPTLHASVVVGKKVAKQAVRRNKIRRRVYAQLYRLLKQTETAGVFIVLIKPSFGTLPRKASIAEISNNIAAVRKKT